MLEKRREKEIKAVSRISMRITAVADVNLLELDSFHSKENIEILLVDSFESTSVKSSLRCPQETYFILYPCIYLRQFDFSYRHFVSYSSLFQR